MAPVTPYEKAAQLIFPRLGSNMRPSVTVGDDESRIAALLDECPIGGLVIFNGEYGTTPRVLERLQRHSRFPLLIGADFERGAGQQLSGATVFPHALAFDLLAAGAVEEIQRMAHIISIESLSAGVHINFAPVADVHSNPRNPIISTRAFGRDPEDVATRTAVFIRAAKAAGLYSVAKHFPGHGDTTSDSHEGLPVVPHDRVRLERIELLPFRAAVKEEVDLIMTAHVAYPALDPSGLPATYSHDILTDLLRTKMGFRGAVVTDSLLMEGADAAGGTPDWAVDLVNAGVDILLDVADPLATATRLAQAVEDGTLPATRLDEAVQRVWKLKTQISRRFGSNVFQSPTASIPGAPPDLVKNGRVSAEIARKCIRFVSGNPTEAEWSGEIIRDRGLLVVLVRPHSTYSDPTAASLEHEVKTSFNSSVFYEVNETTTEDEMERILGQANDFGSVLVAVVVKPAAWHRFGLLDSQKRFVSRLTGIRPVVLAALGSPVVLEDFPDARLVFCTYSDVAVSQAALISKLKNLALAD